MSKEDKSKLDGIGTVIAIANIDAVGGTKNVIKGSASKKSKTNTGRYEINITGVTVNNVVLATCVSSSCHAVVFKYSGYIQVRTLNDTGDYQDSDFSILAFN